jgi:hypothetical protein
MLVSIIAIYLISIRKLPLDTPYLRALISFLNIGMVGFVLASVALRFVFPGGEPGREKLVGAAVGAHGLMGNRVG